MGTWIDVTLKKLEVVENGEFPKGRQASNVLEVKTFPEETAKNSAVKALRLMDGQTIDFTKKDQVSGRDFTKEEIFLIRRELVAPTDLHVKLSTVDDPRDFEKFLAKLFKAAFKGAWSVLGAGIGNIIAAAGFSTVKELHLEGLEAKKQVFVIGEGVLPLDPSNLPQKPVRIPLFVKEAVYRKRPEPITSTTTVKNIDELVLSPDPTTPNAFVTVEIEAY